MNYKRVSTRQHILNVASQLFMDQGFQATSTRSIAKQANITQPNLYHHFKTKEALYIAVLKELSIEVKEALYQIVNTPELSLVEKLQRVTHYLKETHPINFFIMRHDMTHEISSENLQHLYKIWKESYLEPIIILFEEYLPEKSPLTLSELSRYFYSAIAPFLQKDNQFYKELTSEHVIDLLVYGILDREE